MAHPLEDFKVNIRLKLAALWTAIMFCYIYGDYFELYVPGKVNDLLSGQNNLDSPLKLFTATILLTLPSLMIFLSLVLSPRLTKWLNIGIGLFFTLFTLLVGISSISEWRIFYVFLSFIESCLTLIVAIMAWNWPKEKAV
ncbi:MAG: DUF6326 family protein [Algoriphagus sp.]|jgi:hypothetical protein|nr:DUF6326 family protein [Algoriphagus sp.]